ncbi:alpha/beta fold hydrolase [Actinomadura sp. B10D3]|uniref:alpha/beta hydrolase n=1 Tax=Actinomadura sp. B10D3 TaxID=3153557 RepID=UPI00325D9FD5
MPEVVTFPSDGVALEGLLFRPDGPGPHPLVVMAGGWCYVKELVQPRYARVFQAAGIASLVFDYRGFGGSEGEVRQHADPHQQIRDYRNAVSYAETLDGIDPDRIGAWGISYSGGHTLIVGAADSRVRAVASIVPVIDGLETMRRAHGTMGFRRLREAVLRNRRRLWATGEHGYMKHSSTDPAEELCTWPFPGSPPLFAHLKETEAPNYENRNTIESAELLLEYSVEPHVGRLVDTPTLMLLADADDFTWSDLEVAAFNAIPTPEKKLHVVAGTDHHELYRDPGKTAQAAQVCRDWFAEHL